MTGERVGVVALQRRLWASAVRDVWRRRGTLVLLTAVLWVPWRIAIPLIDRWIGFRSAAGFPLDMVADAFYEPLFAGAVLSLFANDAVGFGRSLREGAWYLPRLLLIDIKVAVIAIAVPYAVLHIGSVALLTWNPTQAKAYLVVGLTLASLAWFLVVAVRYSIASPLFVAERTADRDSTALTTRWALRASGRAVRGRGVHALVLILVGQSVITGLTALVPDDANVIVEIAAGLVMVVTTVWWALVWEFSRFCLESAG